jgi:type 2 lantibiotic biosynthesis protein LanM
VVRRPSPGLIPPRTGLLPVAPDRAYAALSVAERLSQGGSRGAPSTSNLTLGADRYRAWSSRTPFDRSEVLKGPELLYGCSKDEMVSLLGEPLASLRARSVRPDWLAEVSRQVAQDGMPLDVDDVAGAKTALDLALAVVGPILSECSESLVKAARAVHAQSSLIDPKAVRDVFMPLLLRDLPRMLGPVLTVTLQSARHHGDLEGGTSEERFADFYRTLCTTQDRASLFSRYPVLARLCVTHVRNWAQASEEFLLRLSADWLYLRERFELADDELERVEAAGDPHCGGRCVLIATFRSGFSLVYKPRSVATELHFQDLLRWFNDQSPRFSLRTLEIIDCGSYGWVELVRAEPCRSREGARRFYWRQGALLALVYALVGRDCHCENLLAVGEDPVIVDLESLFQADYQPEGTDVISDDRSPLLDSVLSTGLLPTFDYSREDTPGIDWSGIGGEPGQVGPIRTPYLEANGTDLMHLEMRRGEVLQAPHRPTLRGRILSAEQFTSELIDGFAQTFNLLTTARSELLSENGPITRFSEDRVRVILRPTVAYTLLLLSGYHPHCLGDGISLDARFDRLLSVTYDKPSCEAVIAGERHDLWQGDIPLFTSRPASRHVWTSTGALIPNFFREAGLDCVRRRLSRMDDRNLDLQTWLIESSIKTARIDLGGPVAEEWEPSQWVVQRTGPRRELLSNVELSRKRVETRARIIGDEMERRAIELSSGVTWPTVVEDGHRLQVRLAGPQLYDGLSGIALALAYMGSVLDEERITSLARNTLPTLQRAVASSDLSIGTFGGITGYIYLLEHLASLWSDNTLLDEAVAATAEVAGKIDADATFDVVDGVAGVIPVLLCLHRQRPDAGALELASRCGAHLVRSGQESEGGMTWPSPDAEVPPLTGFGHGAAGIAWALFQLHAMTGVADFREAAVKAITYERSVFNSSLGNWPDFRPRRGRAGTTPSEAKVNYNWCSGSAGIGMARIRSLRYWRDDHIDHEIQVAIRATLTAGFGDNMSLCHGDLGNLELLYEASSHPHFEECARIRELIGSSLVSRLENGGIRSGVPGKVHSHGLLRGAAGVALGLLRLIAPERVPSVLLLDPPNRVEGRQSGHQSRQ